MLIQLCSSLCDPMNCGLPNSAVHGISQARVLEWGTIAFSVTMLTFLILLFFQHDMFSQLTTHVSSTLKMYLKCKISYLLPSLCSKSMSSLVSFLSQCTCLLRGLTASVLRPHHSLLNMAASSVQFSSVAQSCPTLLPHELQQTRPPCLSLTPEVHSNSCPSSQ